MLLSVSSSFTLLTFRCFVSFRFSKNAYVPGTSSYKNREFWAKKYRDNATGNTSKLMGKDHATRSRVKIQPSFLSKPQFLKSFSRGNFAIWNLITLFMPFISITSFKNWIFYFAQTNTSIDERLCQFFWCFWRMFPSKRTAPKSIFISYSFCH